MLLSDRVSNLFAITTLTVAYLVNLPLDFESEALDSLRQKKQPSDAFLLHILELIS